MSVHEIKNPSYCCHAHTYTQFITKHLMMVRYALSTISVTTELRKVLKRVGLLLFKDISFLPHYWLTGRLSDFTGTLSTQPPSPQPLTLWHLALCKYKYDYSYSPFSFNKSLLERIFLMVAFP